MRIIVLTILLVSPCILCQEFLFVKEDITFRIDSAHFYVDGYYWFVNTSGKDIKRDIYFPVSYTGNEKTDSMAVYDVNSILNMDINNMSPRGFSFVAEMAAGDTCVYRIKYRQKTSGDSACYILLSTQQWKKPLEQVEYKLFLTDTIELTGLSYTYDKIYNIGKDKIYYWRRNNFMPDMDMKFSFRKRR